MEQNIGRVEQIVGPIIDIQFSPHQMPSIRNAIEVRQGNIRVIAEVAMQLFGNVVRAVALSPTDGLRRGIEAVDLGHTICVPVGKQTLGRVFDVTGNLIDGRRR